MKKKSDIRMNKPAAAKFMLVVLMVFCSFAAWGMGSKEIIELEDSDGELVYTSKVNKHSFHVRSNEELADYTIIERDNRYYTYTGTEIAVEASSPLQQVIEKIEDSVAADPTAETFVFKRNGVVEGSLSLESVKGSISFSDDEKNLLKSKFGSGKFLIPMYRIQNSNIYAVKEDTVRLFQINPPFFPNEFAVLKTLFGVDEVTLANVNLLRYKLLLAFASGSGEGSDDYMDIVRTAANDLNQIDDLGDVEDFSSSPVYPGAIQSIKNSFASLFGYSTESVKLDGNGSMSLPYMTDAGLLNESLYEESTYNPYLAVYLRWCFGPDGSVTAKPVLSSLIDKKTRQFTPDEGYNHEALIPFSESDGVSLAQAALRYYSWGVEYSGNSLGGNVQGLGMRSVYNGYNSLIEEWVNNQDSASRSRLMNYLPSGASAYETILWNSLNFDGIQHVISGHIDGRSENYTDGEARYGIVGFPREGKNFPLARADLWESRNLAWDGVIADTISPDNSGVEKLNDKVIQKSNHIRLERASGGDGNTPLEYGYTFTEAQKVSALLIVRDPGEPRSAVWENDSPTSVNYLNKVLGLDEPSIGGLSVLVKHSGSSEFVSATNVKEICYDVQLNSYYLYPSSFCGFGLSVTNDVFDTLSSDIEASQLSYFYYIFDSVEDIEAIKIVDQTGTAAVRICELGVFAENPVSYIMTDSGAAEFANESNLSDEVYTNFRGIRRQVSSDSVFTFIEGNTVPATPKHRVFTNGGDSQTTILPEDGAHRITFGFDNFRGGEFAQIVLSESLSATAPESALSRSPVMYGGASAELLTEGILSPATELEYANGLQSGSGTGVYITTPFVADSTDFLCGNPLPYAARGIDTPRTFAYKLDQQYQARESLRGPLPSNYVDLVYPLGKTTLAHQGSFYDPRFGGYATEMSISAANNAVLTAANTRTFGYGEGETPVLGGLKPFLPGGALNTRKGYSSDNSLYQADKLAGVDSLGLLMGALAMCNEEMYIPDARNENILDQLDAFYEMDNADAKGTDDEGYPVFSPGEDNSFLDGFYRFSAAELERITTIIPSLPQIRPGDLIMRTNDTGETHLGVVVRTNFAGLDSSATSQDYMNSIYLISVNRSLRQVSLATWGNPAGGFGGFSLEPGKYHARRLLKKSATGELSAAGEKPGWELLDEYKVKLRSYYPPATEVPRGVVKVEHENSDVTIVDQNKKIVENLVSGKIANIPLKGYYHRELPTTSFSYRTDQALLGTGSGDTLQKIPALVTQLSGWRNRGSDYAANHFLSYHTGVDLSRWSVPISSDEVQNREVKILAPEDGLFYVWNPSNDEEEWATSSELFLRDIQGELSSDNSIGSYSGKYYGLIGVLITRPDSPKDGRVYLFAHLGDKGNSYISNLPYNGEYSGSGEFPEFSEYPDPTHPQLVTAGTPLAYVGALGDDVPFHVHLEVYEYFNDFNDWLRVDPLSCFSDHLFGEVESGSQSDAYPLYGWWARLLDDEDEYACKSLFQSESNAGILINSLGGGVDYSRGWLEPIAQYSMQHTWIYFREAIQQRIDEVNVEDNKSLTMDNIFRSDRWDSLREINYAE